MSSYYKVSSKALKKSSKARKQKQLQFMQKGVRQEKSDHGGGLKNPQKRQRPLGFRSTTHLVLRSTKAKGAWSFRRNRKLINELLKKFSQKNHIVILNKANVGNHIHLHIQISNRRSYRAFIRGLTAAIYLRITGFSRWVKAPRGFQFWDQRPFSRIVSTWNEFKNLSRYVELNKWEGVGFHRKVVRDLIGEGALAPEFEFI